MRALQEENERLRSVLQRKKILEEENKHLRALVDKERDRVDKERDLCHEVQHALLRELPRLRKWNLGFCNVAVCFTVEAIKKLFILVVRLVSVV